MQSCDICLEEYKKGSGGGFPLAWCHNCNTKICEVNKECVSHLCYVFNTHHSLNLSYCKQCIPDEKEWVDVELYDWKYDDDEKEWIGRKPNNGHVVVNITADQLTLVSRAER